MAKKKDTFSYKGWLNSDSFLKRAFAVFGYYTISSLIISAAAFIVVIFFIAIFALIGAMFFLG